MTILVIKPADRAVWLAKANEALKFLQAEIEQGDVLAKQDYQKYQDRWRTSFWGRVELFFDKNARASSDILDYNYSRPARYRLIERRTEVIAPFKSALETSDSEDIHVHIDCINRITWTLAEIKGKE